jgi:RNA polymerase primary sigma factor
MKAIRITQSITDRSKPGLKTLFKDISKIPMTTPEEEVELAEQIKNGDESAATKLVQGNLRFIISVAKKYQGKGIPLIDLIQSGVEGAMIAAKKWKPELGFKFISYAVWWIRQSIILSISTECRTVRVPVSQINNMSKISKESDKFEQKHNRKPSVGELENTLDMSYEKISSAYTAFAKTTSLSTPFNDDEDGCLSDVIKDDNAEDSDEELIEDTATTKILQILSKFPNRESDVIKMVFGITMNEMTLEEIGARFGVSAERIRQIQNIALNKLRTRYSKVLSELL